MSATQSANDDEPKSHSPNFRYLTYDTELPHVVAGSRDGHTRGEVPLQPQLEQYKDPLTWSRGQKQSLVWQSVVGTALTAYAAGTYAPAVDPMAAEWHVSRVQVLMGITVFTLGFAIAPMILAPFSEINGRRPVFVCAGIIFVVCVACCAATQIYAGMMVARLVAGLASSVFSTMVGGVVADIYEAKDRNTPMALFAGGVLFGTGLGPLVGGFIAENASWRWVFGVHGIVLGAFMVIIVLFFRESRGSVLLSRKAHKLNEWYQACEAAGYSELAFPSEHASDASAVSRLRWRVKADEERASLLQMVKISSTRPFVLLFTEPTVFFFSLWISFSACLYLTFSVIPYVFSTVYAFDLQQSNAVFAVISITSVLFTLVSIQQEKIALRRGKLGSSPEARLWFSAVESFCLPIGLFWMGWTASSGIPWIVPALGVGAATIGIFSIYLATFNYLADTYGVYASSAIAGQSLCRNLLGGAFPLFAEQFYKHVGIGQASSILGAIAILLSLVPWVLALYGPSIRARSPFASGLAPSSRV